MIQVNLAYPGQRSRIPLPIQHHLELPESQLSGGDRGEAQRVKEHSQRQPSPKKNQGSNATASDKTSITNNRSPKLTYASGLPQFTAFSELEWTHHPTEESLSSDAKEEIRSDQKDYFVSYRRDGIFRMGTKFSWTGERMALILNTPEPTKGLDPKQPKSIFNKPTLLYWATSAQRGNTCPSLPFACIHKEWFRYHNNEPDIEFGHFFANPVRITCTGPSTIEGIIEAHRSVCDLASTLLYQISRGKARELLMGRWPDTKKYKLHPLCRAVVVVLDKLGAEPEVASDGFVSVDKASLKQSILMITTGDDTDLSALISLESINAQVLNLARSDIPPNSPITVV